MSVLFQRLLQNFSHLWHQPSLLQKAEMVSIVCSIDRHRNSRRRWKETVCVLLSQHVTVRTQRHGKAPKQNKWPETIRTCSFHSGEGNSFITLKQMIYLLYVPVWVCSWAHVYMQVHVGMEARGLLNCGVRRLVFWDSASQWFGAYPYARLADQ